MSGQYYVTITNASNCTTIGTTSVTVNANPIATSSNTGPYCAGATIELSSGTGSSYSWSGPGGWSSSQQDPDITASTPSMAGVYNVIITGANSCTASSSTTVTIYNNPIVDAGNNTSITFGTYTNLSASVTGGSGNYSYEWSPASSLINSNIQNPQTVNLTVTTTFTVTVTDITTGCATTDNVTISISGTALVLDVSSNMLTICQGETAILNAATTGGTGSYTYLWASSPSGFSASTPSPTVSPTATTTYLVTVSDGFNSANGQVTISVNPIPTAICSNAGIYCAGDIISLIASGGSNYLWSGPAAFTSSLQNPAIANAQTLMNGIYYVTVSNVFGCVDTASTEVVVHPLPIMVVSNNGPFCPGDTIQLFAEGGNVYSWTGPAAFSSTDQNPVIYTANASQTGTYEVIVTSTEGCTSYGQTDISYSDPMTVTSIVETDQASHQGIINITVTGGVNPYTYIWSNGNTTEDINGLFSGTYTITINDALQCAHVESFEINIPLIIPNVITPNNDGKNDDFEILNIGAYSEVSIKVFSRWTEEIFSFKGTGLEYYQTENRWNGTLNGNKLPMGSYLYIVIIDDHEPLTGSVLLKY
jgi:gliding motility-associated-like protein